MAGVKDFEQFVRNISVDRQDIALISAMNKEARDYLAKHPVYKQIYYGSRLIGSYAKGTMTKPLIGSKTDCDIMVITRNDKNSDPQAVLKQLYEVISENKKWPKPELLPTCITLSFDRFDLDFPVGIVDKENPPYYMAALKDRWIPDNPVERKQLARRLNRESGGTYCKIVKIFKWWRRLNFSNDPGYPHGLSIETLVQQNLGKEKRLEDCLLATMKKMVKAYSGLSEVPVIIDTLYPHEELLRKVDKDCFFDFISKLEETIALLEKQGRSNETWRQILGEEFPE